jgi:hypothetical protein
LVHNLFKSPASCNSIPSRQQKPYFNINPQKLLFCCFAHHKPMIYISFNQSPKHATQLEYQEYSKKIQVLRSEFLAELDTPSFQHCWLKFKLHRWTSTVPIFHTFELFSYKKR